MVQASLIGTIVQVEEAGPLTITTTQVPKDVVRECTEEMRGLIGNEVFMLSVPVLRYNKYGWRNTRLLVLTETSLMMVKQRSKMKELRKRVSFDEMVGLTISLH